MIIGRIISLPTLNMLDNLTTVESVKFVRVNFREFSSAVVSKRLTRGQCGPHQQGVRGVKAGELGQTPAPGVCLPSREGDKTTLAFVLGHAVSVGLHTSDVEMCALVIQVMFIYVYVSVYLCICV